MWFVLRLFVYGVCVGGAVIFGLAWAVELAVAVGIALEVALTPAAADAVAPAVALGLALAAAVDVRCGLCLPFSQPKCFPGGVGLVFTCSRALDMPAGSLSDALGDAVAAVRALVASRVVVWPCMF